VLLCFFLGGEKQRPYWKHYYQNAQAVVFVVDSASSDEEMTVSREALHEALSHPALQGLPCLILGNCQDKPGARSTSQV
jgi:GTPase SAR1 family protein